MHWFIGSISTNLIPLSESSSWKDSVEHFLALRIFPTLPCFILARYHHFGPFFVHHNPHGFPARQAAVQESFIEKLLPRAHGSKLGSKLWEPQVRPGDFLDGKTLAFANFNTNRGWFIATVKYGDFGVIFYWVYHSHTSIFQSELPFPFVGGNADETQKWWVETLASGDP